MKESRANGPREFDQVGGRMCLDFVNTVGNYLATPRGDKLSEYAALVDFARQFGVLEEGEAKAMERDATKRPLDAQAVVARAQALREAMWQLFYASAEGKPLPRTALATVNESLGSLAGQTLICDDDGRCHLECNARNALDGMLGPIARSAAELLASGDVGRVKICEGVDRKTCTWLFLDTSKNRSRRWCSMKDCGNRAKARRHYQRAKAT